MEDGKYLYIIHTHTHISHMSIYMYCNRHNSDLLNVKRMRCLDCQVTICRGAGARAQNCPFLAAGSFTWEGERAMKKTGKERTWKVSCSR